MVWLLPELAVELVHTKIKDTLVSLQTETT